MSEENRHWQVSEVASSLAAEFLRQHLAKGGSITIPSLGITLGAEASPAPTTYHCPLCFGTGHYEDEVLGVQTCPCPRGRRMELSPGLRRCPWLAHPGSQLRHFLEQAPHRQRLRWIIPVPFALLRRRARMKGQARRRREERTVAARVALLSRLLEEPR